MPRRLGLRPTARAVAVLVLLTLLSAALAVAPAAAAPPSPAYRPPVDAPVADPFRPPPGPYGAGNRGLDYGTTPGTPVRAAADGVVTFAGLVAGARHVTVLHADGLRTTASYLATIDVVVGQHVHQGDRIGTTGDPLHFSARNGDAYLDPASLFADGAPQVRLVPFDVPPGIGPSGERSAIRQLLGLGGRAWGAATDTAGKAVRLTQDAVDWLQDASPALLRTALHYMVKVMPVVSEIDMVLTAVDVLRTAWELSHRPCTDPDVAPRPPPGRRVVIEVAGLGSNGGDGAVFEVPTSELGYDDDDVLRFSYRGGHDRAYETADTQQDLRVSGRHLADLIEQVADERPGVPIDLFAHSQGGLVARLAVIELEERHGAAWLDRVGLFATMGTPHGGADLATLVQALESTSIGDGLLDQVGERALPGLDPTLPAAAQLSETSDLIRRLGDHPLPEGLHALSIAARGDVIVPVPRARLDGAQAVVVPVDGFSAHDELPGSPEAARELALALAGDPPTCVSFTSALVSEALGAAISRAEDHAGADLWAALAVLEVLGPTQPDEDELVRPAR
jgi:hypothetical protein